MKPNSQISYEMTEIPCIHMDTKYVLMYNDSTRTQSICFFIDQICN